MERDGEPPRLSELAPEMAGASSEAAISREEGDCCLPIIIPIPSARSQRPIRRSPREVTFMSDQKSVGVKNKLRHGNLSAI